MDYYHALLSKKLINYLPTIVPIPRSLLVTNVPMILVKNSGALVPKIVKYLLHKTILTLYPVTIYDINNIPAAMKVAPATSSDNFNVSHIISKTGTK